MDALRSLLHQPLRSFARSLSTTAAPVQSAVSVDQRRALSRQLRLLPKPSLSVPKKAPSAFSLFFTKTYSKVREELDTNELKKVMRVVGQNWKSLSDSAKIDFNGEAATLRQKQREQMDRYLLSRTANDVAIERKKMFLRKRLGLKVSRGSQADSTLSSKPKPKRPLNSFLRYYTDLVSKSESTQETIMGAPLPKEITKGATKAGLIWKSLSVEEKSPFEEDAKAAFSLYTVALEAWKKDSGSEELDRSMEIIAKTMKPSKTLVKKPTKSKNKATTTKAVEPKKTSKKKILTKME